MGLKCSISKELCPNSKCTGYDGTAGRDLTLKKGQKIWPFLINEVPKAVWCDSCSDDSKVLFSADADIVNLSIGEIKKPRNPQALKKFMDRAICTYKSYKARGDCI